MGKPTAGNKSKLNDDADSKTSVVKFFSDIDAQASAAPAIAAADDDSATRGGGRTAAGSRVGGVTDHDPLDQSEAKKATVDNLGTPISVASISFLLTSIHFVLFSGLNLYYIFL